MFVMGGFTAQMDQMRMMNYVQNGFAQRDTGNVAQMNAY